MKNVERLSKLALQTVVLSMDEIRVNLQADADNEAVKTNAEAMLALTEAFIKIAGVCL